MKKWINPNILDEGNQMEVLHEEIDSMKTIVRCNNCGKPTVYGNTRMISGYVGCDNKIKVNNKVLTCYEDLSNRVMSYHNSNDPFIYKLYVSGLVYRWRDLEK